MNLCPCACNPCVSGLTQVWANECERARTVARLCHAEGRRFEPHHPLRFETPWRQGGFLVSRLAHGRIGVTNARESVRHGVELLLPALPESPADSEEHPALTPDQFQQLRDDFLADIPSRLDGLKAEPNAWTENRGVIRASESSAHATARRFIHQTRDARRGTPCVRGCDGPDLQPADLDPIRSVDRSWNHSLLDLIHWSQCARIG